MPSFAELIKRLPRHVQSHHGLDLLYLMLRPLSDEVNDVYRIYNKPGPCDVEACEQNCVKIAEKLEFIASKLKIWQG